MNNSIGSNIKNIESSKRITQKELGELINKSLSTIQKYESGDIETPFSVLQEISKALSIDIDVILSDNKDKIYTRRDVFDLFDKLYTDKNLSDFLYTLKNWNDRDEDEEIFLNAGTENLNLYKELAQYLLLDDTSLYNWIITDSYDYNLMPSDKYKLTYEDYKYLIDNKLLENEDISKLVTKGLSRKNIDIIHNYFNSKKSTSKKGIFANTEIESLPQEAQDEISSFIDYIKYKYSIKEGESNS